jgi:leader peptidase (prepilin peptidase) / N-methyltransferase
VNVVRLVLCALLALPVGWFAAVLVDRVPEKDPLFRPLKALRPSGRDLVVHALVLVLFVLAAIRFADASLGVVAAYLVLFTALAALTVIDIECYRLPDRIVLPTFVVSVPLVAVVSLLDDDGARIRYALAGAALYFGFLFLAHLISPRGMGFGDVKLAAVMGLYVGWLGSSLTDALALVLWAMLIGFLSGTLVGLLLLVVRRGSRPFPFGPFLAVGTVAAVMLSESLVPG